MDETQDGEFEVTHIYQFQLPNPSKNSPGPLVAIERSDYDPGESVDGQGRKKIKDAAREAGMQRNFEKLIDEGMLLLEGEEADRKYIEIMEKVKRMQKLQDTQEQIIPQ